MGEVGKGAGDPDLLITPSEIEVVVQLEPYQFIEFAEAGQRRKFSLDKLVLMRDQVR